MNAKIMTLAAVAALLAAGYVRADDEDTDAEEAPVTFERYRSIIDRYPFGVPPPNFDPHDLSSSANAAAASRAAAKTERELTQEENKLKAAVRLCAFNLTPERRVMVGFVDNSHKPPASYYLAVGDSRGGWTVKSADVDEKTVVLEKDGVEVSLEFPKPGSAAPVAARGGKPGARPGPEGRAANAGGTAPGGGGGGGGGALERLRERRAQIAKNAQEEEERRKAVAEKEKADRAAAAEEREQQKQQLLQIQEELRRAREQREREQRERDGGGDDAAAEGTPVEI